MNVTPRRPLPDRNIMQDISDMNTNSDPPSSPFMANPDADVENLPPADDMDDTMCSTFSAVPTPKRNSNETANLIVDFTEQFNSIANNYRTSPTKRGNRLSPSKTQPELAAYAQSQRTPSPKKIGRMSNLLDFDIPPAPTPRSMPSITPRELETLRSGFLCEISNLKAELSGKEAETAALKKAVADAEKRTGENMEKLREEQQMKEQLAAEKELLEKRGNEMEQVLRNVKEEIVLGEREREELEGRLDECDKRREAAEMMHQEAESRIAAMRAGTKSIAPEDGEQKIDAETTNREVELAVEKVARELHTLYKSKHETKVAALKKSYEGRWQRKVKNLEDRLELVTKDCEDLRTARDATMSGLVPTVPNPAPKDMPDFQEELKAQAAKDAATAKELGAKLLGLTEEVKCINRENASLRHELDNERVEKGELVAAVEEMFELQMQNQNAAADPATTTSVVENLKSSVSRASGLRMPSASSESRIGKIGVVGSSAYGHAHERNRSGSSQSRTGSAQGTRSGIMSSIEKMGGKGL